MRRMIPFFLVLNGFLAGELIQVIRNPYASLTHQVALALNLTPCVTDAECGCTDNYLE